MTNGGKWDGRDRRKSEGGRRSGDFCSEHCILKKFYEKEFESLSLKLGDINLKNEKNGIHVERIFDKLEKRHENDQAFINKKIDEKLPTRFFYWLIGILIPYMIIAQLVLWTKLNNIEKDVAVVKSKQETILKRHDLEETRKRFDPYYRNNSNRNGSGRDARDSSNK